MKHIYKYVIAFTMCLRMLAGGRIFYVNSRKAGLDDAIYPSIAAAIEDGAGERYFDWIFTSLVHQEPT